MSQTKTIGIIPARYASSRFPGKPLVDIAGKSMIQRVYEQAIQSHSLDQVVVATDDDRIFSHVDSFGGNVLMTADTHQSGTDRCAEVLAVYSDFEVAINIQGDEPYIDPAQIDLLVSCFENTNVQIATLIKRISTVEELFNTGIPKVVVNHNGRAIYFSRQTIPFQRNAPSQDWLHLHPYYKHIGIYGYRAATLAELTKLPISSLERAEALEQLRWIENGYLIQTAETTAETIAVDTPEDLERLKAIGRRL
ncbi:3-deoxy-manno-octulosonate cytidylyltransferase [Parapedobacter koreensis]|uniref:3-deoxy-manno-octulosonate cytidylyltransferase n=1 Tax=Parapedobacter koreensis TaxID=332977 RepID=A0A1H7L9N6_9SPHI|nr:3-deoxy-manno-octulosonate cytidylyltransferase [Parapedobacter koreensis]SEK95651.1 3-deoxy-manno-octulosonate cytidylyltransferase (CMP-KDO synthetase) [Parapedobacter koreensis]